ncbi:HAAS domain-containing protein [Fructobacillus parabroussonetiae]|uniref:DUF1700 domain-containing protein n=1 Tax=Fructobacillus parabroussonetiae TaxID=2713174 RepID=A0ABS5QWY1_9LACO|nr:DUF1700 domain-containing protein [Fructobacillus parabroussonetiae]MBS9337631.1 DUF1700 domain-containing protein [Fructobacillus parabroussonetiae]
MTYIEELEQALGRLKTGEREQFVQHYADYLNNHQLDDWAARKTLGTPAELAEKIQVRLANQEIADQDSNRTTNQGHAGHFAWLMWLTAPLYLGLFVVLFFLVWLPSLLIWSLMVAFILAAAFVGVAGVVVVAQSLWGGAFYIGLALLMLGIMFLLSPLATFFSMKSADWTRFAGSRVMQRLKKGLNHE